MGYETDENLELAERLQELLRSAWPGHMTSTELVDQCGLRRRTWTWCSGDANRCMATSPRRYVHTAVHRSPTATRYAHDAEGRLLGWDEYEVDVSLQQVNPALNKLHKKGLVVKQKPKPGSRSVLWFALDHGRLEEHEAEALEILRRTLAQAEERGRREQAERESRLVVHGDPEPPPPDPEPEPEPEPERGFFERLVFC